MASGWSPSFWERRHSASIIQYPVSERRQNQLAQCQEERHQKQEDSRELFMSINRLQNADADPLIHTEEATDLEFWASWTFCEKCAKLEPRKLLPAFRRRAPTPLHNTCKCSNGTYVVPDVDDVPLLFRNVTIEDERVLSPFDILCGDYVRMFNGYRQRTGPFRISWCREVVQQEICRVDDPSRRAFLQQVHEGRQLLLAFHTNAFPRRTPTILIQNLFFATLPRCRVRSMACPVPQDFAM